MNSENYDHVLINIMMIYDSLMTLAFICIYDSAKQSETLSLIVLFLAGLPAFSSCLTLNLSKVLRAYFRVVSIIYIIILQITFILSECMADYGFSRIEIIIANGIPIIINIASAIMGIGQWRMGSKKGVRTVL